MRPGVSEHASYEQQLHVAALGSILLPPLNLANVRQIVLTEDRMAIKMLRVRKVSSESWGHYFQRRWRRARSMLASVLPSLPAQLIQQHHRSVGHLFRHSIAAVHTQYLGSPFQHMLDPSSQGTLSVGRPRRWERVYHDYYGAGFPEQTFMRESWKKGESEFMRHLLRCWRYEPRSASETA